MSRVLIIVGCAGLLLGLVAAVKGSLPRLRVRSRGHARVVIALSLLVLTAGTWLREPLNPLSSESQPPAADQAPVDDTDFASTPVLVVEEPVDIGPAADVAEPRAAAPAALAGTVSPGTARAQSPAGAGSACEPSYPEFCISPAGNLGCAGIGRNNFTVLPPDPQRLDADGDGLGCNRDSAGSRLMPERPPAPVLTECDDGADNDGDGELDLLDPGCSAIQDDSEAGGPAPPARCDPTFPMDCEGG